MVFLLLLSSVAGVVFHRSITRNVSARFTLVVLPFDNNTDD